ncbi:MAG TPA: class I SAM-dependent methyltransferase [Chloroflexota bacterium]|jgi:ubiquinone/menaquinone biosynthesis C-methylase UbiE|nr:class I SAM-dependent methyltransferase [Chloroflexota bacterium]
MPRFDAEWIEAMLGPERAAASPPEQVLDLVAVATGDRVADVGCGPGFLTLPAARRVGPAGVVWALDAAPEMVRLVAQRALEAGLDTSVRPLLVASARLPLDDDAADVVLCSLVLHFLREPDHAPADLERFCRELRRIAAPDGRLLVIEWQPRPGDDTGNRLNVEACATALRAGGWDPGPPVELGSVARRSGRQGMYAVVARAV